MISGKRIGIISLVLLAPLLLVMGLTESGLAGESALAVSDRPEGITIWDKSINGQQWMPGLVVSVETSDTLHIAQSVDTTDPFVLEEIWDPDELSLMAIMYSHGAIITGSGFLQWVVPAGPPQLATMDLWFHIEPCTWTMTLLQEELWVGATLFDVRNVIVEKEPPALWIDSFYDSAVLAGQPASFTLGYGNGGGYENNVMIRNEFPAAALFVESSPLPDRADPAGAWVEWDVGDLAGGDSGLITVTVDIAPGLPVSTTIDVWDYIYDHVRVERNQTLTRYHVEPFPFEWHKFVDGDPWSPGMVITRETSDTVHIIDEVGTFGPYVVVEFWEEDKLALTNFQASHGNVVINPGTLEWIVPPGAPLTATLEKWFHIEPCLWTSTTLLEELWLDGVEVDTLPVAVNKLPADLWIDSFFDVSVFAGEPATFTLEYGNDGGYENDVMIRNEFPPEAPFLAALPAPDRVGPMGAWVEWDVGDLPGNAVGEIDVAVEIASGLPPSTTIDIWDFIYDHAGVQRDATLIQYHVISHPPYSWEKWVNEQPWNPVLTVPVETGDSIQVVDEIATLAPFELVEEWDSQRLNLVTYATSVGTVTLDDGLLEWNVQAGPPPVAVLTKTFEVLPCTWLDTTLQERLWLNGIEVEGRPVSFSKTPPDLWIDSFFDVVVQAGEPVTFALTYGNSGGYENSVMVRSEFPAEALLAAAVPAPDRVAGDSTWAEWDVGDLAGGDSDQIEVTVDIASWPAYPDEAVIEGYILNHVDEVAANTQIVYLVGTRLTYLPLIFD